MENVIFYKEWQSLPKAEFEILAIVAEQGGSYSGTYADICRYKSVSAQSGNRRRVREAIEALVSKGFLTCQASGRMQNLQIIPKETKVELSREWVRSVIAHDYSSEDVSFAQVLKVFMWLAHNEKDIITNKVIADDLCISESTVVSAKNVIEREYKYIYKEIVAKRLSDDSFMRLGQRISVNAWWTNI